MKAEMEPLTEVMRIWRSDAPEYGDAYIWFATIRWLSYPDGEAEIIGVTRRITEPHWNALQEEFARRGVKRVLSTSYPNGADGPTSKVWIESGRPFNKELENGFNAKGK